jgi:DNA-binding GntR family transcriptional regulator
MDAIECYRWPVPVLTTKADEVARTLEDEIVSGAIPPGQVLRQEHVCERFNVSRTPVREALQRLEALGLVTALPNRGARVRSISSAVPSSKRSQPLTPRRG